MKRSFILLLASVLAAAAPFDGALAQAKKKSAAKKPTQEEMMKRWQDAMTPGDAHKVLEQFVGSWDAESKYWMSGPTGEPAVSKGSAEYKMILGGRFLRQDFTGDMMGQPMTGVGYTGYDNFTKRYVGTWMDNFSTAVLTMDGTMDKQGKTLTMTGKMNEPATGEKDKKVKYVVRWVDKDKHVFESYDVTSYGDRYPVLVITYTRK